MSSQFRKITGNTIFVSFVVLLCLCSVAPVFAQGNFVPLTGAQVSKIDLAPYMTRAFNSSNSLAPFVNALFKATLAIGAMIAVLQIARAGFLYMTSDVWGNKEKAKQLLRDALMGLLLLMAIWLILNQINPQILNLDALNKLQPLKSTPADTKVAPTSGSNMKQFTQEPAPNSFMGGAGNQYDSSINNCGTSGCDTFNPNPISP